MAKGDLLTCLRCFYFWRQRLAAEPLRCANPLCRTPYWNRERRHGHEVSTPKEVAPHGPAA